MSGSPRWRPIIAANWRCNLETIDDIEQALNSWKLQPFDSDQVDVVVCSSLIHAAFWRERVDALGLQVSAQVCSSSDSTATWETATGGCVAFTAHRLRSLGVNWTVLGHSDWRRRGETDTDIAVKLERAQAAGLKVILCIGYHQETEGADHMAVVRKQLDACMPMITRWEDIVLAYEPPRAAGSFTLSSADNGMLTPAEVEQIHVQIREYLEDKLGLSVAEQVRVQYAGSVFPGNCVEFLEMPNIDGFLVNDVRFKYTFMKIVSAVEGVERRRADFLMAQREGKPRRLSRRSASSEAKVALDAGLPTIAVAVTPAPAEEKAPPIVISPPEEKVPADSSEKRSASKEAEKRSASKAALGLPDIELRERRSSKIPCPASPAIETGSYEDFLEPHGFAPDFRIYDMRLYEYETFEVKAENVRHYFNFCQEADDLVVTTSCFSVWRKAKKRNYNAKVIPAVPKMRMKEFAMSPEQAVRVFFFDDNVNLHLSGAKEAAGICNLRDVVTGEYVDFSEGCNGFKGELEFRHTCVHYSSEYQNVLIQANILDAMIHPRYFNDIIEKYSEPGERLILFFDVNGTILCDDTVASKGVSEILLSDLFRFAEVRPRGPTDFVWGPHPPFRLEEPIGLKDLVHEILSKDNDLYHKFWCFDECHKFVKAVVDAGIPVGIKIQGGNEQPPEELSWTAEHFQNKFKTVLEEISRHPSSDGIPRSWFACYDLMKSAGHSIVLNSLGTDTQRIVLNSVCDRRQVLQVTINFKEWTQRDVDSWKSQFTS